MKNIKHFYINLLNCSVIHTCIPYLRHTHENGGYDAKETHCQHKAVCLPKACNFM